MGVVATWTGRVRDWKALQRLNRETLLGRARDAGASRYRLYRNLTDASQVLVVAELPDAEAVREMARAIGEQLGSLMDGGSPDDRVWEAAGFEGIG